MVLTSHVSAGAVGSTFKTAHSQGWSADADYQQEVLWTSPQNRSSLLKTRCFPERQSGSQHAFRTSCQKSPAIKSTISQCLQSSTLFNVGGNHTTAWIQGGDNHWRPSWKSTIQTAVWLVVKRSREYNCNHSPQSLLNDYENNSSTMWWCRMWYQQHGQAAKGTQKMIFTDSVNQR